MKYMDSPYRLVQKKVMNLLPEVFALIFDGWSCGQTHYIGLYASFPKESVSGYEKVLLAFAPMNDESSLNADEHIKFVEVVLSSYGKWWNNVAALIGDNCSTNRCMARKAQVNFIGCASHRFNLAVKDILAKYEDSLCKVNALMKKLKTLVASAKLRKFVALKPKTRNVTRWNSTHDMLKRYQELKEFIPLIMMPEVADLMLSPRDDREIDFLLKKLHDFESVTKTLQKEDINLNDVRILFDGVIEEYPETLERLSENADIIHDALFESAVVKILNKKAAELSFPEKEKVCMLKVATIREADQVKDVHSESMSFAERALKRSRFMGIADQYLNLSFLRPRSNMCERLFSIAGYAYSDRRQSTYSSNFGSQIFLHINSAFWSIDEVNEIFKQV
jgi:hypothetical protein